MLTVVTNLGFAVCVALALWIVVPYVYRLRNVRKLQERCARTNSIVLTYDDGPSANFTAALLGVLEEYNAPATFFTLGVQVDNNSHMIPELIAKGHEVGSHSYAHLNAWKDLPWRVAGDIEAGVKSLDRRNVPITYFRPPNGKITLGTLIQTWLKGRRMAWWTIDSSDTWENTLPLETLVDNVRAAGGGVVLLHDFERKTDKERNNFVLDVTRQLLELAKTENFKVRTFGQLMQDA
ncbi:polysaccharide deacetylase family protein [Sneathiella sp.]|uniref:polysaccharide deacetylase family protein n=1 Tax=Sneathiella sp. TaxID=1964365 RepID=UPI002FE3EF5A